ncbi:hypothetical protein SAMN06265222_102363 [Neorhodopirellula lusitana]|uniref:Uncharacterized protein n=1 Tax=Neorhodopirellula lusitana TaxID=445327 RepID=A0ABY1PVZ8_9BACT|nr:hypothetical protein [Neorhodopirellula lusitana]SMP47953.1 hypothetical protein SAMN06265222_102363 [Neorhodopirellula lusitana]
MPEQEPNKRSTLDRFLSGLSEYIFQSKLGIADVQLIEYVSGLMIRFTRVDAIQRVRRDDGLPATEVFQMLCEAERRIGTARREVHRHIGDVTLFWSGMFPESVRGNAPGSPDQLLDYFHHGKRSYKIASTIQAEADRPPCDLLDRLSDQFELCAYGLREIRREWEESDPSDHLLIT